MAEYPSRPNVQMTKHYPSLVLLISLSVGAMAQTPRLQTDDEAAIRSVIAGLTEAWAAGDGDAWAGAFSEDADFTVWFGLFLSGRDDIAWGHNLIFNDFYAGTTFHLDVRKIRFLGPDYAVVHLEGSVTSGDELKPSEPDAVPLIVLMRVEKGWKIIVFQNTPYVVEQFRENGDLRRFKKQVTDRGKK